jgi:electron transfer flavoprotein alpha subunit
MILAYLENNGADLPKSALVTITATLSAKAAHGHDKAVGVLLGGDGVAEAADKAAGYGLDEVVYVENAELGQYLASTYTAALKTVVDDVSPALLIACANTRGKDLLPKLALHMDAGQASDVLAFLPDGIFQRPMYAGNVIADVEITSERKVASIRSSSFDAAVESGQKAAVRAISVSDISSGGQTFVSFDSVESARPELTEAEVVVSGGRAMKSTENFETYIAPLADVLGAAIGASRAAVDSGYAPNDWQVGQTGKVVAPNLYIAIGISGAIQHLAGMKDSKCIVAINKDPDAPIFEVADYGLVADLYETVPSLTEELKKASS